MRRITKILLSLSLMLFLGAFLSGAGTLAQQRGNSPGPRLIDSDGDGVPNCVDPDYVRPMDGSGQKFMRQLGSGSGSSNQAMSSYKSNRQNGNANHFGKTWMHRTSLGQTSQNGFGWGPGNGTGNNQIGPQDGTGYGPGGTSGICDGTGPKGRRAR